VIASAVAAMMSSFGPMVLGLIGDRPCRRLGR
jgi:predicted sugar kinase